MAGLLNAEMGDENEPNEDQEPKEAVASEKIDDPLLKRVQDDIEAKVPQEMKRDYLATVVAGMRIMYGEETAHLIDDQLQQSDDIVANVSEGIAKLIGLLRQQIGDRLNVPAAALASISLMANALDYAEQKFDAEITPEIVSEATKQTMYAVLGVLGIDKGAVDAQVAKGQGGQQEQPQQPQGLMGA